MTKSTLTRFWRLLQSRPDLGDVEAAWRTDLRKEWDMVRSFFKPTDSLANSYHVHHLGTATVHAVSCSINMIGFVPSAVRVAGM
jgi:hypothetical protein